MAETGVYPNDMGRSQIMFMSMGEPLLNLKALIPALSYPLSKYPKVALLVSTAAPKVALESFIEASVAIAAIGLQFSVHESTDFPPATI